MPGCTTLAPASDTPSDLPLPDESSRPFPWERLTYVARRIDNSTVHLVLRGSTAGSVQKAS